MSYRATLVHPKSCNPPHRITHPERYDKLVEAFLIEGWDTSCPPLIGYQPNFSTEIQLLSGSHRWAAALEANIDIPVIVYTAKQVDEAFGDLDKWANIMEGK